MTYFDPIGVTMTHNYFKMMQHLWQEQSCDKKKIIIKKMKNDDDSSHGGTSSYYAIFTHFRGRLRIAKYIFFRWQNNKQKCIFHLYPSIRCTACSSTIHPLLIQFHMACVFGRYIGRIRIPTTIENIPIQYTTWEISFIIFLFNKILFFCKYLLQTNSLNFNFPLQNSRIFWAQRYYAL